MTLSDEQTQSAFVNNTVESSLWGNKYRIMNNEQFTKAAREIERMAVEAERERFDSACSGMLSEYDPNDSGTRAIKNVLSRLRFRLYGDDRKEPA